MEKGLGLTPMGMGKGPPGVFVTVYTVLCACVEVFLSVSLYLFSCCIYMSIFVGMGVGMSVYKFVQPLVSTRSVCLALPSDGVQQ